MNKFLTCFFLWSGARLLSHIVSNAVPSAAQVLTVVFGMGTGVSPERIDTGNICYRKFYLLPSIELRSSLSSACAFRLAFTKCSRIDNSTVKHISLLYFFPRKEVIQPHLPIRLPCYDFTPVIRPAFGSSFFAVRSLTSGVTDSHGVTGGVYKTRERIHRGILIRDY